MISRLSKILLIIVVILTGVFLIYTSVDAATGLVHCGRLAGPGVPPEETRQCGVCDILVLASRIINFSLFTLVPAIAVLLYLVAGFLILLGGANPGLVATGRGIFKTTTWGVIIIFASWMITNSVLKSIAGNSPFTKDWNKVVCIQPVSITPTATPTTTTSITPGPSDTPAPTGLSIVTVSLPDAIVGRNYSQQIQATGGEPPLVFSILGSSLPPGLTINNSGVISGTPTTAGVVTFTVKVSDSTTFPEVFEATKQLSIKIVAAAASVVISNVAVSNITATGAVITWTTDRPANSQVEYGTTSSFGSSTVATTTQVTSHSVTLTGLTSNSDYSFRVKSSITGFNAVSSTNTFKTLAAVGVPLSITTASLPDGVVGTVYSQNLQGAGGRTPYVWTKTVGNLPPGTAISTAGAITGTPTTAGEYAFTIRVEDATTPAKQSATKQLSIKINAAGPLACLFSGINLCQGQALLFSGGKLVPVSAPACHATICNQYSAALDSAAQKTGVSLNLLRATMYGESRCQISASNPGGDSYGLMQLKTSTANTPSFKASCGVPVSTNITSSWLMDPANVTASICISAYFYKSLAVGACGYSPRNLLAGASGGPTACQNSSDCASDRSCDGGAVRKWECLYDNPQHTVCNGTNEVDANKGAKYNEARYSVVNKLYCVDNPGPWVSSVTTGDACTAPPTLAQQHNEKYPAGRAPELETLLSCMSGKLGQSLPSEGSANAYYGTLYTYDRSSPLCNYTRGDRHCDSTCSHVARSCHYGGASGSQGALAVDLGNETRGSSIINAALACGAKAGRCENARGQTVACTDSSANHIHINSASCDSN